MMSVIRRFTRLLMHGLFLGSLLIPALASGDDGLLWQDLSVHVASQRHRRRGAHCLVQPTSFFLSNGHVCGLLGPSGSGKSTLLQSLLAGTASFLSSIQLPSGVTRSGQVVLLENKTLVEVLPSQIAWLQQQDDFFELLTVRETLHLAAYLELPHISESERVVLVDKLLDGLGLSHVSNSKIGSANYFVSSAQQHGARLSGGERRRLSVALELVTEKRLVLADEPTSGLDSVLSIRIVKLIRTLAQLNNVPCIVSLHQPQSAIWNDLLDDVVILAPQGRIVYAGSTDDAVKYFAHLGFPVPPHTNPAEFLVDLVSIDHDNATLAAKDEARIEFLAESFRTYQGKQRHLFPFEKESQDKLSSSRLVTSNTMLARRRPGVWLPRWMALLRRSWRQNIRYSSVNLFRLVANAGNAYLLSAIFPSVSLGSGILANSVADRVALLSFGAINLCMMAYLKTIELFSKERPIVQREQLREQYSALEYLLAKAVAELPFDACFAAIFTTVLKYSTGLRISWKNLTACFSLLTVAGGSLGFAIGSWTANEQLATTAGIPILVILMVVGVINPSGANPSLTKPLVVQLAKHVSPFACCIEALCVGEFKGMRFSRSKMHGGGVLGTLFHRLHDLPRMGGLALVQNGDQVLDALGLSGVAFKTPIKYLVVLVVGNLFLSWCGLLFQRQRHRWSIRVRRKEAVPCSDQQRVGSEATPCTSMTGSGLKITHKTKI